MTLRKRSKEAQAIAISILFLALGFLVVWFTKEVMRIEGDAVYVPLLFIPILVLCHPLSSFERNSCSGGLGDAVTGYVLYDPWIGKSEMMIGGGWIDSPQGVYSPDPELTGKATFWFCC